VLFFIARAYRNNLTARRSCYHTPCNKPRSLSFRAPISVCGSPSVALLATSDWLIYSPDAAGADGSVSSIINKTNELKNILRSRHQQRTKNVNKKSL
jgi:hypothetical protein